MKKENVNDDDDSDDSDEDYDDEEEIILDNVGKEFTWEEKKEEVMLIDPNVPNHDVEDVAACREILNGFATESVDVLKMLKNQYEKELKAVSVFEHHQYRKLKIQYRAVLAAIDLKKEEKK